VEHVPSYQDLTDENQNAIHRAGVVVEQLFDLKPQADTEALPTPTPPIFILWLRRPSFGRSPARRIQKTPVIRF
jgi:hypothetical protein